MCNVRKYAIIYDHMILFNTFSFYPAFSSHIGSAHMIVVYTVCDVYNRERLFCKYIAIYV